MTNSLQKRLHMLIRQTLDSYRGAWLLWCDPHGEWRPLLTQIATDQRLGVFPLVMVDERTAGELGSPLCRRQVQVRIEAQESFLLLVPAAADQLGWLWGQALLAERLYDRHLRDQLLEWGWHPPTLTIDHQTVALLARQRLLQDPAQWGGGGLQPNFDLLLKVLAGEVTPSEEEGPILAITLDKAGLPQLSGMALARWRERALARLLVTQAHQVAPSLIPETHELLIASTKRQAALNLLVRWADSLRLRRTLPDMITKAERYTTLSSLLAEADARYEPLFSLAGTRTLFLNTCQQLAQLSGQSLLRSLAELADSFDYHARSFWGTINHAQALPWSELLRLSRAAQGIIQALPEHKWATSQAAIEWYVSRGWQMDQAGEEILRHLHKNNNDLLTLITPLRAAYRACWEHTLIEWSDLWSQAGCPTPALSTAGEWLRTELQTPRATAILMIDALRYDIGVSLAQRINQQEGAERATVHPARAPLPSITPLGMASALPIAEKELIADLSGGKWRVQSTTREAHELSLAGGRRAYLQAELGLSDDAFLSMTEGQDSSLPEPAKGRSRLILHDNTLDKLGHDEQLEAMGTQLVQKRYHTLIQRLRDAGWKRILIVTDHGYIHWAGQTAERISLSQPNPDYLSRRAAAYPTHQPLSGPQALSLGGKWRIALARGAACFRAYGGLGYFHGGASLQEWIIPCVHIEWPLKAQPVGIELMTHQSPRNEPAYLPPILSQRPSIRVRIVPSSPFIEESLSRKIEVVVRHAHQRTLLFRSHSTEVSPEQEQTRISLRVIEGVSAPRNSPLLIEVRDSRTEEILATGESALKIELTGW